MAQGSNGSISDELINNLRRCGHFLHFKASEKGGRQRILSALLKHGTLLQRELQNILGVQSGSLSEIIIKMESAGLIEKARSQRDGRQLVLRLTPEGLAQAKQIQEEHEVQIQKMLSCLSERQQQELHHYLEILLAHWTTMGTGADNSHGIVHSDNQLHRKRGEVL